MITFTVTNKHRPKATIVMLVSLYGKQYKKSIGIGVPVKYWNDSKKRARTTADFKEGNEINDEIDRWEEIGKRTVKYFTDSRISPAAKEFADKIAELTATMKRHRMPRSDFSPIIWKRYISPAIP